MRPQPSTLLVIVAALAGFYFAAMSTSDFVAHLDRQVHAIHCSFTPGLDTPDASGGSGCHTTLMSPYSSVLRTWIWGGIPVSLPAMAVFGFLAFFAIYLLVADRQHDSNATGFLALATLLPLLTSLVMGYLAIFELDAACKLCIGIYAASFFVFIGAMWLWQDSKKMSLALGMARGGDAASSAAATVVDTSQPLGTAALVGAFLVGAVFVSTSVLAYVAAAPDFEHYVGACGQLAGGGRADVFVPIGPQDRSVEVVEILDPLCPACRGFERRFRALEATEKVRRKALLFPLDNECNWMVDRAIHPGACAISEAILCADGQAEEVLEWAFDEQDAIRQAAASNPSAARQLVEARFPRVRGCVGAPRTRAKLNNALRWAVANQLPVLTPQVYVGATRVCDEDTDLGMDYVMSRLIERPASAQAPAATAPAPSPTPTVAQRVVRPTVAAPAEAAPTEAPVPAAPVEAAPVEPAPTEAPAEAVPAPADAPAPEAPAPEAPPPVEEVVQ